ncbi:hypothetical protein [Microbacterium murale]|uniref:DUF5667 domain-containing protein n=1 Tax=Microbacterium murale TaxID=1081040 RepID=A0ABU0PDH9_9MICO|nr:hypothetical protein [Microbacterium murale]MDQ0645370.1 hypothetical protein [Microbacterium murale]
MTTDLEDLLDASAPATRTVASRDVRAMLADARKAARVGRRPGRVATIAGVLALTLTGGAGVATATDYWASLNNPLGTYTYQVPSGAMCESVFGDVQITERSDRVLRDQIESDLKAWFDRTDVVAVAESQVDEYIQERHDVLEAAGQIDGELSGDELDMAYAYAIDRSISEQAMTEVERLGYAAEGVGYGAQGRCPELMK